MITAGLEWQVITIVALIVGLAFWSNNPFLYLVAAPVVFVFGMAWYDKEPTNLGMVYTGACWGIAAFCAYKVIEGLLEGTKRRQ